MQGRNERTPDVVVTADDIVQAKSGDAAALGKIFRRHNASLVRYLRSLAVTHAEDVAGQVWVDVATGLHRFNGDDTDLQRWLFTIARRRMIDAFRRQRTRPEDLSAQPEIAATEPAADAWIERLEWAEEILQQLPQAQAEVVLLRTVAGFSVDEVAAIVDKSPGAVRVLAHRGLERVLELLAEQSAVSGPITATPLGHSDHSPISSALA